MDKNYNKPESLKKITERIEEISDSLSYPLNWDIKGVDDKYISLQIYSLEEQDFNIDILHGNDEEIFMENLYEYYSCFDTSNEASYWLDDNGHGINGAPYEMIDVYNDMDWCRNAVLSLYNALKI